MTLIEQLERANGPDRELDRAIAKVMGWHRVEPRFTRSKHGAWISPDDWIGEYSNGSPMLDSLHGTTLYRDVPAYTASIDCAMTLADGMTEAEIWAIWNEALARCSKFGGDMRKDVARYWSAAALCARSQGGE